MADLPDFAEKLNDIEVAANAPLTETLMRKFGSNINFLLNFLGIANGSTSASGTLSDFIQAVELIQNHTITKQGTFSGGSNTIGTYGHFPFVNHVFWTRREIGNGNTPTKSPRALTKALDGGSAVMFEANPTTPAGANTFSAEPGAIELVTDRVANTLELYDSVLNGPGAYGRFQDGVLGTIGYESPMRDRDWEKIGVLSWRDYSTQAVVASYHEPVASQMHVWLSYELDIKSAGFYA